MNDTELKTIEATVYATLAALGFQPEDIANLGKQPQQSQPTIKRPVDQIQVNVQGIPRHPGSDPDELAAWKALVAIDLKELIRANSIDLPSATAGVGLTAVFYLPRPSGNILAWDVMHTVRPDINDLMIPVLEVLHEAGVVTDDGQIGTSHARKALSPEDRGGLTLVITWESVAT